MYNKLLTSADIGLSAVADRALDYDRRRKGHGAGYYHRGRWDRLES
jgi:hypothetical protein